MKGTGGFGAHDEYDEHGEYGGHAGHGGDARGERPRGDAGRVDGGGRPGHARQQGLSSVGGQHDAFARGPRRGLLALSTLRHRDSY
ncbi:MULTISPECIES: hypothetical protein [unclassified Streptomyces]|uniref:hypothetical protein n=1 Tax=unclassified Streptomyces TaxID=2593676 RepID=UPI0004CCC74B|nr:MULTISPECIES: hypothetical protein [unclassified Streptomyces]KOV77276.1 hypothetical protein ADL02_28335 [Streptomyces sp. NRRL WC-3723]